VGLYRMNARGEGKIMFDLFDFLLCDFFLEHSYHMNRGIPVIEKVPKT
jgi:hypothetical protein